LVLALAFAAGPWSHGQAQTADVLPGAVDGGFEAGGTGWVASSQTQLVLDGSAPVHGGSAAAHLVATGPGIVELGTQYWLVPAAPQVEHTLRVWVYEDDPRMSAVEVELQFFRSDGVLRNRLIVPLGSSSPAYQLVTVRLSGLDGTAYARIVVRGTASAAGAALHVDDVTLERAPLPPPAPTPTATVVVGPTVSPTSPPGATVTPAPTTTPVPSATSTPTPAATATPTATPAAEAEPRLFDSLTNGGFEDGLYGWRDIGAEVDLVGGLAGGGAARLTSSSTSTKYLYQAVRVTPGAWYAASARLLLGGGVDAAWVRVAWYASEDGSGSQLATGDSPVLTGGDGATGDVATGPLQAPPEAHTAQVRIMLRPLGSALAQLTVDDVRFAETSAPPPPPATPDSGGASAATTVAGGGSTSNPRAVDQPVASAPPASAPAAPRLVAGRPVEDGATAPAIGGNGHTGSTAGSTTPRARAGAGEAAPSGSTATPIEGFAGEIMLRITELLPDPQEPGNDADFEWVEVTNIGTEPISLAGVTLRDNSRTLPLPDMVLPPGVSLVLAGPRAAVPEASAFWPAGGLFNGLGNSGDRLALIAPDGRLIDALSYGSDITYDNPPLPAPGAGRSLRRYFGDDGAYAGFEVSAAPSPGRIEPPPPQLQATPGIGAGTDDGRTTDLDHADDGDRMNWIVLAGLGTIALAAAGGQRAWALMHRD